MFTFKTELIEEFLKGRSQTYIANIVGVSRSYLNSVMHGHRSASKMTAYAMVKASDMNAEISDFFDRKEG